MRERGKESDTIRHKPSQKEREKESREIKSKRKER